jgi:HK97 family phage prohead protease
MDYDPEAVRADAKYAMADGSYPISSCAEVTSAARLAHHSKKYSFDQVKAHVMKAKRALGCPDSALPSTWMSGMNSAGVEGDLVRAVAFEMASSRDGLTLEGYAAVFNSPTRISSWEGEFDETIARGAFARTLGERTPVLMFNHGKHPLIGDMPLGVIQRAEEDRKGVFIQARLSDNWLIQPVRDAVRDGAVNGMSFRFSVPPDGETWADRRDRPRLRTLTDIDVRELGPVVFPAYEPTTATVRSALDSIPDITGRLDAGSAGGGDSSGTAPGNGDRPSSQSAQQRHRDLLIRGIIRA